MILRYSIGSIRLAVLLLIGVVEVPAQKAPSAKPFERFDGYVLEPDEWTDGDSFRVRLPDGGVETSDTSMTAPSIARPPEQLIASFRNRRVISVQSLLG